MILLNRKELETRMLSIMSEHKLCKNVSVPKQTIQITQPDGRLSTITVADEQNISVDYSAQDIASIMDICLDVIKDAIGNGEPVSIRGFGSLRLHYRAERQVRHPHTGERVAVAGRFVPKFDYGSELVQCAQKFEQQLPVNNTTVFHDDDEVDIDEYFYTLTGEKLD